MFYMKLFFSFPSAVACFTTANKLIGPWARQAHTCTSVEQYTFNTFAKVYTHLTKYQLCFICTHTALTWISSQTHQHPSHLLFWSPSERQRHTLTQSVTPAPADPAESRTPGVFHHLACLALLHTFTAGHESDPLYTWMHMCTKKTLKTTWTHVTEQKVGGRDDRFLEKDKDGPLNV